ncbi:MAG: DUF5666 domain-containing protein [Pseudomonadota bacterium]
MKLLRNTMLAAVVTMLVACGGGGGGGATSASSITAAGTITGFGSIFVNGIEFETGSSSITLDDNPGIESDLRLGMVVRVSGTVNADGRTGTAQAVAFDDEVQGPVATTPVDPTGDGLQQQFTVLGITVVADRTATVFDDGVSFDTLALNDYIEVSGFVGQGGVLNATRIQGKGAFTQGVSEIELKGVAGNVAGTVFDLGGFTIETAGADLSGVPGGVVTNGMEVEVKGTLTGNQIAATRVSQDDDLFGSNVDKASLRACTNYVSDADFSISGQQINAANATFSPQNLVLANGVEIEVEGPVVNGVLVASKVEARGGNIKLAARVQGVGANSLSLQFNGGTVEVTVDSQTSLRDDTGSIGLGDITAPDYLEIRASINGNSIITADEVRRAANVGDDILQGPADNCTGTDVTVLGVGFSLLDGTTSYQDQNNSPIANAAAFCAAVNGSSLYVKVRDDQPGNGIADEAELEN